MKKYYQSVTYSRDPRIADEWINYAGDDKATALNATRDEREKLTRSKNSKYWTETREYDLIDDREFESLSGEDESAVLSSCNIID